MILAHWVRVAHQHLFIYLYNLCIAYWLRNLFRYIFYSFILEHLLWLELSAHNRGVHAVSVVGLGSILPDMTQVKPPQCSFFLEPIRPPPSSISVSEHKTYKLALALQLFHSRQAVSQSLQVQEHTSHLHCISSTHSPRRVVWMGGRASVCDLYIWEFFSFLLSVRGREL